MADENYPRDVDDDIDPDDPAKWGTLMRGHWFWDLAFLNSNYHLEHHMFPLVPYHNLPKLHEAIKDDTPTPYTGLWDAWKEIIDLCLTGVFLTLKHASQ